MCILRISNRDGDSFETSNVEPLPAKHPLARIGCGEYARDIMPADVAPAQTPLEPRLPLWLLACVFTLGFITCAIVMVVIHWRF